jgi:arylsulfatase A-like enzyme
MNNRIPNLTNFVLRFAALFLVQVVTNINADEVSQSTSGNQNNRYNVLFIAVDDLNDWVGCFGGNSQAITPNLDRLAKQQAMVMNKAYCPSTVCCPSRSSILTGKRPSTTGIYGNTQDLKKAPKAKDLVTLPEYFGKNGYHTLSTGKIFHKHPSATGMDEGQWAFHEFEPGGGGNKGMLWEESPLSVLGQESQEKGQGKSRDKGEEKEVARWGACKASVEDTKDYVACKWAADQLNRDFEGKPFFMALGISKPHLPWIVPQQFFDLYPLDKIQPVEIFRDDHDDIVDQNGKRLFKSSIGFFEAIDNAKLHRKAQRAYLANISYVDHCLGVLFDALQKSKYADNTILMLWGDHGWHLSEKMKYGKTDLWEESDRVPFIVRVPGMTPANVKCDGVVNLLDMYPTLVELCGLPPNAENEGRSFAPLLQNPKMEWNHPTLTTYQFKNHSLTDGRYRYTRYGGKANGAEELYDHSTDPLEHMNLASNPESKEIIAKFKTFLPAHNEPDSPTNNGDKKAMRKVGKRENAKYSDSVPSGVPLQ